MSLREQLRSATREKHAELDAQVSAIRPFESVEGYRTYLRGMRELYVAFGDALDTTSQAAGIGPRRNRLVAALEQDLAACGGDSTEDKISEAFKNCHDSGSGGEGASWGAAYVLEGSTMGAQMLVRSAEQKLPAGNTVHFLTALAADGVPRFKQFCAALDTANVDANEAIRGALAAFEHALEWFRNQAGHEEASVGI